MAPLLDVFCAGPPRRPADGQLYLRRLCPLLRRASADAGRRTTVLLAMLEIGFHEQAPARDRRPWRRWSSLRASFATVLAALFPAERWSIRLRRAGSPAWPARRPVDRRCGSGGAHCATKLPQRPVDGHRTAADGGCASAVTCAPVPAVVAGDLEPALRDLLAHIDPTPDGARRRCRLGDLADRPHFIRSCSCFIRSGRRSSARLHARPGGGAQSQLAQREAELTLHPLKRPPGWQVRQSW